MKKDKVIEYIFATILCIVLFFNLFVLNVFNNIYVLAGFLLIYLILCRIFVKRRKVENISTRNVIILITGMSVIHIIILYIIGIFAGFYRNPIIFSLGNLYTRILPLVVIIIVTELIRNIFITRNNKKSTIMITVGLVLVDIVLNVKLYNIFNLEELLSLIGYVGLSSISINIMCNYIVKRYSYIPNIIYRIITTIYLYIFAILPDIYVFFQTVYKIIFPFIIYLILDLGFSIDHFKLAQKNGKTSTVGLIIGAIISISIVLLISCQFRYGIMVVGSGSMTGSIDKGDAIVFEQYKGQELEEGQIILFIKNKILTIHRIEDIQVLNNETIYYTKGDNNQQQDEGYRTAKDITGVVKFKIKYIGWPTIWINELFSN